MITAQKINKIRQVIRFFETSKVTGANYGAIATFNDGPVYKLNEIIGNTKVKPEMVGQKRKQVTYGASQTTEYGNLKTLLQMYIEAKGKYATDFITYIKYIGDLSRPSLATSTDFIALLKLASKDVLMQETQDRFFNIYYFNPAHQWCERNGLTLPFSILVIYDSFVHSGSILEFLRERFGELVPAKGGDEKRWITAYVNSRDEWLENHSQKILQSTDYRTDSFIYAIRNDNWNLDQPFKVVNYAKKDESDNPKIEATIV